MVLSLFTFTGFVSVYYFCAGFTSAIVLRSCENFQMIHILQAQHFSLGECFLDVGAKQQQPSDVKYAAGYLFNWYETTTWKIKNVTEQQKILFIKGQRKTCQSSKTPIYTGSPKKIKLRFLTIFGNIS